MYKINNDVLFIIRAIQDKGFQAYLCGGTVRDLLVGQWSLNWDIATSARPSELLVIFQETDVTHSSDDLYAVNLTRWMLNGKIVNIQTFVDDIVYKSGLDHEFCRMTDSVKKDAARRDLTINSMYYDPFTDKLLDFNNGLQDLFDGTIRFVGASERRLNEDALRSLRAVRLASTLNFKLHPSAFNFIKDYMDVVPSLSMDRVRPELFKCMSSYGLEILQQAGFIDEFIPELTPSLTYNALDEAYPMRRYPASTLWSQIKCAIDKLNDMEASSVTKFAALFYRIAEPVYGKSNFSASGDFAFKILKRLGFIESFCFKIKQIIQDMPCPDNVYLNGRQDDYIAFMKGPNYQYIIELHHAYRHSLYKAYGSPQLLSNLNFFKVQENKYKENIKEPLLLEDDDIINELRIDKKDYDTITAVKKALTYAQVKKKFHSFESARIWLHENIEVDKNSTVRMVVNV